MSLARRGWLVGFTALAVLGAACGGEEISARTPDDEEDAGGSSGNDNTSGGNNGSSGANNGSSGNGSSGNEPDGGPITGPSTTVTGSALAPNGLTPLGQVTVSWTRTAPAALPTGPFCSACTAPPAGTAAISAADGSFQLTVPVNEDVFLVTQMGNFRRVRAIRFAQTDTTIVSTLTTLPGRLELAAGDTVPSIGILPSNTDDIADALDQLGVKGLVDITANDLANPVELQRYQIVLVPGGTSCENPRAYEPSVQTALRQYVSQGGALYVSDYNYQYFDSAFPGFVQFGLNGAGSGCLSATPSTGRYDDVSLATWLGAPATGNDLGNVYTRIDGTITQSGPGRDGAATNLVPKTWATITSTATPTPAIVSVPYGCGQAFMSSVTGLGTGPSSVQRNRALAFTVFRGHDGCIESPAPTCVGTAGAQCTPGSPPVSGAACGYCGTSVQRCSNECKVLASACQEQQAAVDRCLPGGTRTSSTGCPVGSVRTQSCQVGAPPEASRCTWAAPAGACTAVVIPFIGVNALGTTTTRLVAAADQQTTITPEGPNNTCPSAAVQSRMGALTEIRNDSGAAIKVDVTVTPKRNVGGALDRRLTVYGIAPPLDEAATKTCAARNDDCANPSDVESCVNGFDIPAGGKIWAQVTNYGENVAAADFSLNAKRIQ